MVKEADSGSWFPDPIAPKPCFGPTSYRSGGDGDAATACDDEIADLTSGMFSGPTDPISDPPKRKTAANWDGVKDAADPASLR